MLKHLEYLDETLKQKKTEGKLSGDVIEFYRGVYRYQEEQFALYRSLPLQSDWIRPLEMPVVDATRLSFSEMERPALSKGLMLLLDVLEKHQPGMNFASLRAAFAEGSGPINEAAGALLEGDMDRLSVQAADYSIGVEEYIFILLNWFKPYFAALAERYGPDLKQDEWMESRCPVCGFYSSMAKIVGARDGRRFLHCGLCEYEWHYKRIACPICGNEDTEKLGYFTVDGQEAYRVDYCDECKGYIKTIIMGKFQEPGRCDLAVLNVLTSDIDAAAMQKGYSRP